MQRVDIAAVGRVREPFLKAGCAEYQKRIAPYCRLVITEIPEEKPRGEGEAEQKRIVSAEGARILRLMEQHGGQICALAIEGETVSSEKFADFIRHSERSGGLMFVVGGSLGLAEAVGRRADRLMSFSRMTFPHQMARMMLMEQLYRAISINAGFKYHK